MPVNASVAKVIAGAAVRFGLPRAAKAPAGSGLARFGHTARDAGGESAAHQALSSLSFIHPARGNQPLGLCCAGGQ